MALMLLREMCWRQQNVIQKLKLSTVLSLNTAALHGGSKEKELALTVAGFMLAHCHRSLAERFDTKLMKDVYMDFWQNNVFPHLHNAHCRVVIYTMRAREITITREISYI